jgi:hypothetical protein
VAIYLVRPLVNVLQSVFDFGAKGFRKRASANGCDVSADMVWVKRTDNCGTKVRVTDSKS